MNSNFRDAVAEYIGRFDGTIITLPNGTKITVARNPDSVHQKKLFEILKLAKEYDPAIEFSIGFCIAFSQNCKCGSQACLPLFGQKVTWDFPVPQEVLDFFKYLQLRPLPENIESLRSQLQRVDSEIERLEDLLRLSVASFNELYAEVEELQKELANIQSEFHQADNHSTALRNLLEANRVASTLFGKDLAVIEPEFFTLIEQFENRTKTFFDQMTALTRHLSLRENMVSVQKQAIHSHQTKLIAQVQTESQAKIALLEAKKRLWSKLKELGPENIPSKFSHFLEAESILSKHIKRMLSTNKVTAGLVVRQSLSPAFLEKLFHQEISADFVVQEAKSVFSAHLRMLSAQKIVHPRIEASRIEASRTCAICLEKKSNYFILGCSHGLYCMDCIRKFQNNSCPACRRPIQSHTNSAMFNGKVFYQ